MRDVSASSPSGSPLSLLLSKRRVLRLVSRWDSTGSSCNLFPLRFISVTDRMCAHEKFGFRKEMRSSNLLRGILICVVV